MKTNLRSANYLPEIPLAACPNCRAAGFMALKSVRPRLRYRDGIEVEYICPKCQIVRGASVRPDTGPQPEAQLA